MSYRLQPYGLRYWGPHLEEGGGVQQGPITPQADDEVNLIGDVIVIWKTQETSSTPEAGHRARQGYQRSHGLGAAPCHPGTTCLL